MTETSHGLLRARYGPGAEIGPDIELNPVHTQQLSHRSHRRFKPDPVPQETLDLLFACALSAPSKSDLQQVSIINFDDEARRNAVTDLMPKMPWLKQAPVFLLFCGDGRRIKRICDMRGTDFAHDPLDAFMNTACDAAIVMQNFITAVAAAGLGCCPISGVRSVTTEIAKIANLPDDVFPFAGLCVGYPTDEPKISRRLGPKIAVHKDVYDDRNLEDAIKAYDAERLTVNPISRQRDVDTYGEVDPYGWSTDKARQTSHTDRLDFVRYIKRHFFRE